MIELTREFIHAFSQYGPAPQF